MGLESPIELKEGQKVTITPAGSQEKGTSTLRLQTGSSFLMLILQFILVMEMELLRLPVLPTKSRRSTHQGVVIPNMDFHSPRSGVEKGFDYASLGVDEFIAQGVDSLILPGFMDLAEIKVLREKYPYSKLAHR